MCRQGTSRVHNTVQVQVKNLNTAGSGGRKNATEVQPENEMVAMRERSPGGAQLEHTACSDGSVTPCDTRQAKQMGWRRRVPSKQCGRVRFGQGSGGAERRGGEGRQAAGVHTSHKPIRARIRMMDAIAPPDRRTVRGSKSVSSDASITPDPNKIMPFQ